MYRYFLQYGYDNLELTLHVLPAGATTVQITKLEQYYINLLQPDLNVDPVAGGLDGFHGPMSQENRDKLQKERGLVIYVYDTLGQARQSRLLHIFPSKTVLYEKLNIHHRTLNKYLYTGDKYLDRFVFSYQESEQYLKDSILSVLDLSNLLKEVKSKYKVVQPATRPLYAENVLHSELSKHYSGVNEFAKALGGDRASIRSHIDKGTLYRNQWKITTVKL